MTGALITHRGNSVKSFTPPASPEFVKRASESVNSFFTAHHHMIYHLAPHKSYKLTGYKCDDGEGNNISVKSRL